MFHAEKFKSEADRIRAKREARNKKRELPKGSSKKPSMIPVLSQSTVEDNLLRNFIRSCMIGAPVKCSPRQTFANIAGAALADGPTTPIYGYDNPSERSIVAIQVFSGFILRASLMKMINNARVIGLFPDTESYRKNV